MHRVSQSSHFVLAKSDLGKRSSVLVSVVDGILDADTFVINQSVKTFFFCVTFFFFFFLRVWLT